MPPPPARSTSCRILLLATCWQRADPHRHNLQRILRASVRHMMRRISRRSVGECATIMRLHSPEEPRPRFYEHSWPCKSCITLHASNAPLARREPSPCAKVCCRWHPASDCCEHLRWGTTFASVWSAAQHETRSAVNGEMRIWTRGGEREGEVRQSMSRYGGASLRSCFCVSPES